MTIAPGTRMMGAMLISSLVIFPSLTLCAAESREVRVFIWDGSGNESFLGNMMECVGGSAAETVCWNFPDEEEDGPWEPFA